MWFEAVFFGEEKAFPVKETDLKISARWRYDTSPDGAKSIKFQTADFPIFCACITVIF